MRGDRFRDGWIFIWMDIFINGWMLDGLTGGKIN